MIKKDNKKLQIETEEERWPKKTI